MEELKVGWKSKALAYYEQHELRFTLAFFLGGFLFDVFTLADIDDPFAIAQQVAYLLMMGFILSWDFIHGEDGQMERGPVFVRRIWAYRSLAFHFFLGSLLSMYSLFFLKSASFFSSAAFVLFLVLMMVGNELKTVQKSGLDAKIALYVISVFCFFSMMIPILLGRVGQLPFLLALGATALFLLFFYRILSGRVGSIILRRRLLAPGFLVAIAFTAFYWVGWIPPVPLSAEKMGIYHRVERVGDVYQLYHERPWWKFWQRGDQEFRAEPGDRIFFFVSVFSPARFEDSVFLRWSQKHPTRGWQQTDRIEMKVRGGRKGGYRGAITKQNYSDGEWRISVETSDAREIGRMYFTVERVPASVEPRQFQMEEY